MDDVTKERLAEVAKRVQERTGSALERAWKFIEGTGILDELEKQFEPYPERGGPDDSSDDHRPGDPP